MPMVSKYLSQSDIQAYQQTSNIWCIAITIYLSNCFSVAKPLQNISQVLCSKLPNNYDRGHEEKLHFLRCHVPRQVYIDETQDADPFLGKMVTVDASKFFLFFRDYLDFLHQCSTKLYHIHLRGDRIGMSMSPASIYMMCVHTLKICPNLKTLRMTDWEMVIWSGEKQAVRESILGKESPSENFSLESFTLLLRDPKSITIQDKLLEKYSAQLKRVEIQFWNKALYLPYNGPI